MLYVYNLTFILRHAGNMQISTNYLRNLISNEKWQQVGITVHSNELEASLIHRNI